MLISLRLRKSVLGSSIIHYLRFENFERGYFWNILFVVEAIVTFWLEVFLCTFLLKLWIEREYFYTLFFLSELKCHVSCRFQNWFNPTIIFIIFRDSSMLYQIFHSPQAKWCAIITYKHGIYELSHELSKYLRL